MITIDITKAKEIHKTRLRKARVAALDVLDIQFQRAMETGSDTTQIVANKQSLRDITKLVDGATTINELIAVKLPVVN